GPPGGALCGPGTFQPCAEDLFEGGSVTGCDKEHNLGARLIVCVLQEVDGCVEGVRIAFLQSVRAGVEGDEVALLHVLFSLFGLGFFRPFTAGCAASATVCFRRAFLGGRISRTLRFYVGFTLARLCFDRGFTRFSTASSLPFWGGFFVFFVMGCARCLLRASCIVAGARTPFFFALFFRWRVVLGAKKGQRGFEVIPQVFIGRLLKGHICNVTAGRTLAATCEHFFFAREGRLELCMAERDI